jgi:hypothetical protein
MFELKPRANGEWAEEVLHSFVVGRDGTGPDGALIFDSVGNIYGTLTGNFGGDVAGVFELSLGSGGWSNTVLYSRGAGPGLVFG